MNLAILIILAAVNFIITAQWIIRRQGESNYPLWIYILTALFCWFPIIMFPTIIAIERQKATQLEAKEIKRKELYIAIGALLLSIIINGVAHSVLNGMHSIDEVISESGLLLIIIALIRSIK